MKSFISVLAMFAMVGIIVPTQTSFTKSTLSAQTPTTVPTCPDDITQPCGTSTDDAGRTIIIGDGFAPVTHQK